MYTPADAIGDAIYTYIVGPTWHALYVPALRTPPLLAPPYSVAALVRVVVLNASATAVVGYYASICELHVFFCCFSLGYTYAFTLVHGYLLLERSFDGWHARRGLRAGIYQVPGTYVYTYLTYIQIALASLPEEGFGSVGCWAF